MELNTEIVAGLTPLTLAFSLMVVFLAAIVRGYTGFGFSALLVTSLSLVMPPSEVVPIALMMEVIASAHMLPKVWRDVDRKLVGVLFFGAVIASPLGVHLLASIPTTPMRATLYIICLCAALTIWRGYKMKNGHGMGHMIGAGLISGVVNGATAMGGLMVVIFLLTGSITAAAMRASMIAFFFVLDTYATAFTWAEGLLTSDVLLRTAIFVPPLLLGNLMGHRKFVTAAPESFRRYTLILLMSLSGVGLIRTFTGF
ncbi:MAG: sulfite exporter TauE/SafE family protein [Rhodospirillales bacterium]|jgi:uncharacterized protein|nr:sulfite exporter TauE/SafE family protein [Rhodospirillales bacterium]